MSLRSDPSRPLRERDAAASPKREPRPAPDPSEREQRMQYEREQLQRNRSIEQRLDHALIESFPASDPLALTPEGAFPVQDPRLADDRPAAEAAPDQAAPAPTPLDARGPARHRGEGARHATSRPDAQTVPQPTDPAPPEPLPPQVPGKPSSGS